MRSEKRVEKNYVIYALKFDLTLLNKRNKLIILVPTRCATKDINGSPVHTALNINAYKKRSLYTNISKI